MIDDKTSDSVEEQPIAEAASVPPHPNDPPRQNAQEIADQPEQNRITNLEDRIRKGEKLMILLTGVIAFFALCSVGVALLQYFGGGKQTDRLIDAANKQANAATSFSQTADRVDSKIGEVEKDFQTMAESSKDSIKATQDAMRLDQRAWVADISMGMDAPEIGKKIRAYATWSNSGKSFAKKVRPLCHLAFVQNQIATENILTTMASNGEIILGTASLGVLAPNAQYKTIIESVIAAAQIDKDSITGNWYTYIWGEMTYDDIFGQSHRTIFCSYRQGSAGEFLQCPFHNDAN